MALSIREAALHDADAVIGIWQDCDLTRPWNDPFADFNLALGNSGSTVLIAEDAGSPVGTVMTGFDGHRGWIYYLGTVAQRQNQGIARHLIDAAENWLAARGCPKVELMVRTGNPAAAFYEKIGWEKQDVAVYARWLNTKED